MNVLVFIMSFLLTMMVCTAIYIVMDDEKLYEITYQKRFTVCTTIVGARNEFKAIKKIHKMNKYECIPMIISIKEIC